jgi:hypothetical protein
MAHVGTRISTCSIVFLSHKSSCNAHAYAVLACAAYLHVPTTCGQPRRTLYSPPSVCINRSLICSDLSSIAAASAAVRRRERPSDLSSVNHGSVSKPQSHENMEVQYADDSSRVPARRTTRTACIERRAHTSDNEADFTLPMFSMRQSTNW